MHCTQTTVQLIKEFPSLMSENSTPLVCLFFTGAHIEAPVYTLGYNFQQIQIFQQIFQIQRKKQYANFFQ